MKLKFKLLAILATLGIVSTGFAAWNFATPTEGNASINVDIENYTSLGRIEVNPIGQYNLAQTPNPLAFTATYHEDGGGVAVSELNLTYTVILNEDLGNLIDFGANATGTWVSGVEKSITPVWKEGKNPTSSAAYNAIKANLANLHMTVSFTATRKTGLEPVAPGFVAPAALPAGFEADEHGVIAYDKDKGQLQLGVVGLTSEGGTSDGVAQNFNWSTSDATRATVVDGLVTPLADGDVTITATAATLAGKGLKKAEGAAKHEFKLHITGFTPVFVPIATSLRLVLGTATQGMALEINDTVTVSAEVLDQENNVMADLNAVGTVNNAKTASYVGTTLTALAAEASGTLTFSYEELTPVVFNFTVNAPAPVIKVDHIVISGANPLNLETEAEGKLEAKVYDVENVELTDELVTWSSSDEDVIIVEEDGLYLTGDAGTAVVTATSVSKPEVKATLNVDVTEPAPVLRTITIVYGHGNANGSLTVEDGQNLVGKITAPEVVGYTFDHWEVDSTTYELSTAVNSDLIVTAAYTRITYSVSFDLNGGTGASATRQIPHGEKATNPGDPTRYGYTFLGWFNGANVYDFDSAVTGVLNLKAHWEIKSYTVTFDTGEGATPVSPATVNHGQKVTEPAAPTRDGYTFDGWLLNEVPYNFDDEVTGDLTLNAKWVEDVVMIIDTLSVNVNSLGLGTEYQTKTAYINGLTFESSNVKLTSDSTPAVEGFMEFKEKDSGYIKNTTEAFGRILEISFTQTKRKSSHDLNSFSMKAGKELSNVVFQSSKKSDTMTWDFSEEDFKYFQIDYNNQPYPSFVGEIKIKYESGPLLNLGSVEISSEGNVTSVEEKATLQLSALVKDIDGNNVNNANLSWKSLNEDAATVSNNGLVTAKIPGTAMIEVTATREGSSVSDQFNVTITARAAERPNEIVLVGYEDESNPSETVLLASGTMVLETKVFNQYDEEMTAVNLVWKSSDTAVATVSNGTVTLLEGGTSMIKVYVDGDSAISAELKLIVNEDAPVVKKEVYATGFESSDGFTSGTNYQKTLTQGSQSKGQFTVAGGTASTSSPLVGSQSMQLRTYKSGGVDNPSLTTKFKVSDLDSISFIYKIKTAGNVINVEYSLNSNFTNSVLIGTIASTAKGEGTFSATNLGISGEVYIRIIITGSRPSATNEYRLDTLSIFGSSIILP